MAHRFSYLLPVAFVILLTSGSVSADTGVSGKISSIQSYPGHTGLLVNLAQSYVSAEGCSGQVWYIFPDDSVRAAAVQAMLLSAQASRMSVSFTLSGCYQNYPRISAVTLTAP